MVKLPWPFNRGKADVISDAEFGVTGAMLQGDSQRTTSEVEMQRDLGTNFHMTESQELMDTVKALAQRHYKAYVKNDKGEYLKDDKGNVVVENKVWYHPVFTALYIEVNRLHSMRWLDPTDAEMAMWQVKYNFKKMKMKLSYEEYTQWGGVVDALERLALGAISDSLNGRKPKLLKVQPRTFEVEFKRQQKGQEPGGFMPR